MRRAEELAYLGLSERLLEVQVLNLHSVYLVSAIWKGHIWIIVIAFEKTAGLIMWRQARRIFGELLHTSTWFSISIILFARFSALLVVFTSWFWFLSFFGSLLYR